MIIEGCITFGNTFQLVIKIQHDLGHTPFGHAGQDALNDCMKNYGGFEHNLQSLRADLDFFRSVGDLEGNVKIEDVVDDSFAEAVVKELGPYVKKK